VWFSCALLNHANPSVILTISPHRFHFPSLFCPSQPPLPLSLSLSLSPSLSLSLTHRDFNFIPFTVQSLPRNAVLVHLATPTPSISPIPPVSAFSLQHSTCTAVNTGQRGRE